MKTPAMREAFATREFALQPWQSDAVAAWRAGDARGSWRGTLEIFTGGGKTMIALACAAAAAAESGSAFRLIVVVPTFALAEQWERSVSRYTTVAVTDVRRVTTATTPDRLARTVVAIVVINTAAKIAAAFGDGEATMLVVDECHRAGATTFRHVLAIRARFRLGLSATPERDELDERGEPLRYDEQVVARELGGVVVRFDLARARAAGLLPTYAIDHHGVALHPDERRAYEEQSRLVDDLGDRLRRQGSEPSRARQLLGAPGEVGAIARSYLAAVSKRKDVLYRARERTRVARSIVDDALANDDDRILIFNERIDAAQSLYDALREGPYADAIAIEHSKLSLADRAFALARFRDGSARLLVSAKSLIEGIDVPQASVGISVASTGSVRQRVQALGRVLRRGSGPDGANKRAAMHLIYVANSVDEYIYEKEDWGDLTGGKENGYRRWALGATEGQRVAGPPRTPRPTEAQEHVRLEAARAAFPARWFGVARGLEYHVDTRRNVTNASGATIANAQGVADMLARIREAPGGKIVVTPAYRYVLVSKRGADETQWFAGGRLAEPFVARVDDASDGGTAQPDDAPPGSAFVGAPNEANGTFFVRARDGGCVERKVRGGRELAVLVGENADARVANARTIVAAWRTIAKHGFAFFINDAWQAWYRDAGEPRYLARVAGGFAWPSDAS